MTFYTIGTGIKGAVYMKYSSDAVTRIWLAAQSIMESTPSDRTLKSRLSFFQEFHLSMDVPQSFNLIMTSTQFRKGRRKVCSSTGGGEESVLAFSPR